MVGNEHIEIRDHVMHGIGHSYTQHLTAEGVKLLLSQLQYLSALKPRLLEALAERERNK